MLYDRRMIRISVQFSRVTCQLNVGPLDHYTADFLKENTVTYQEALAPLLEEVLGEALPMNRPPDIVAVRIRAKLCDTWDRRFAIL